MAKLTEIGNAHLQQETARAQQQGRRVTCDSHLGSLATQGHLRLVGVTDDSKLGSLVPTGFFKGNTFRVKNGAYSPALGGDTGTWGLGVGLGDNL